jgi:hypothetical protein
MKAILILGSAVLLSACTAQAVVPPVSVDTPLGETPVAGNYAATVQTGGWALQTKSKAFSCGAWTFEADVNSPYEDALRNALARSLEKVDFTPEILSPDDLRRKGYNAQIVVHQGNADSSFLVSTRWFSTTARADIELSVILAIRDGTGLIYQNTATGKGSGSRSIFACPSIGQAVGASAQTAVRTIVRDIIVHLRDGLRDRRVATKP